ncbi:hypothetical protein [Amycolatopsis sp. NPDC054798]
MTHDSAHADASGPVVAPEPSAFDEIDFAVWFRVEPVSAAEVGTLQRHRPAIAAALDTVRAGLRTVEAEPASQRKTSTARRKHKARRDVRARIISNLTATLDALDALEPGSFNAVYCVRTAARDLHHAWRCLDACGLDTCAGYKPIERLLDDARSLASRLEDACSKAIQLEGGLYTVARYAPAAVEAMLDVVRARPDVLAADVLPPATKPWHRHQHPVEYFDQLMRDTATAATPIAELHNHGATWHQTNPLRDHLTTVEELAELLADHRNNPATSLLAAVPSLGPARIEKLAAAVQSWTSVREAEATR